MSSDFETRFADRADRLNTRFGVARTVAYPVQQDSESVTLWTVEDVGANDPFVERTFYGVKTDFVRAPYNGCTIDTTYVIQKVRDTEDGTYEIRCRAPEEIV